MRYILLAESICTLQTFLGEQYCSKKVSGFNSQYNYFALLWNKRTTVFKCNLMFSIGPFLLSCSISHLPLFCQGRLSRLPKINEGLTL